MEISVLSILNWVISWAPYSLSSTNYLGVPNSAQWTYNIENLFSFTISRFYILKHEFVLIIILCEFKWKLTWLDSTLRANPLSMSRLSVIWRICLGIILSLVCSSHIPPVIPEIRLLKLSDCDCGPSFPLPSPPLPLHYWCHCIKLYYLCFSHL